MLCTLRRVCIRIGSSGVADVLTTEKAAPSKGTRPEGATNEADASRKGREMFAQIAPRYDLLNHLLSLQLDRVWRARTARKLKSILDRPDAVVLDLCCGTGDLAFALKKRGKARVIGADFAHPMLCGRLRSRRRMPTARYRFWSPMRCGCHSQMSRLT